MKGQSRWHSLLESGANIAFGFILNYGATFLIFPLFGLPSSMTSNLGVTLCFTTVAITRQYGLRRYFNRLMITLHIKEQANADNQD